MTHLTETELREWYARGHAPDRVRVLGHLADCDACRRSLALMAQAPLDEAMPEPAVVLAEEVVARGYAAYRPAGQKTAGWAWLRPAYGVAALAAMVAAVVLLRPAAPVDEAVRGSNLQLIAPIGLTRDPVELRWASPLDAPRYRVVIEDAGGVTIHTESVVGEQLLISPDLRRRLARQTRYTWFVEALDEAGAVLTRSSAATFEIGS